MMVKMEISSKQKCGRVSGSGRVYPRAGALGTVARRTTRFMMSEGGENGHGLECHLRLE
jgi:hypothetical protein